MGAVAKNAAVDSRAGKVVGAHRAKQGLVQWLVLPTVALADVNAHQLCLALDLDVFWRGGLLGLRNTRRFGDRRLLHLDHAGPGHLLKLTQQLVDLFTRLDKFDLQGKMVGNLDEVRRVHMMIGAKPRYSLENGCAGNATKKEEVEDAGRGRNSVVRRALAQVDRDFHGFSRSQHIPSLFRTQSAFRTRLLRRMPQRSGCARILSLS